MGFEMSGLDNKTHAPLKRDCKHITFIGERISYVDTCCRKAFMVGGNFAVNDAVCARCRDYKKTNGKTRYKYG